LSVRGTAINPDPGPSKNPACHRLESLHVP
jgi:hypothetical protein